MYFLGISGPPRAGKDSLAHALEALIEDKHKFQPQILSLSLPMREAVMALAGLKYEPIEYERSKDLKQPVFHGRSIREEMIELSERHMKPRFGHDFWAKNLLERRWSFARLVICPDIGFGAEVNAIDAVYGRENCVWVQLDRPDRDWGNDSRGYCGTKGQTTMIHNAGERYADVVESTQRLYSRLVNQYKWVF